MTPEQRQAKLMCAQVAVQQQIERCLEGEWICVELSVNVVHFVRKSAPKLVKNRTTQHADVSEALRTCATRLALQCSVDLLRRHWQYSCSWRTVQMCYRWLCDAVATGNFATHGLKGAFCNVNEKVQQLLHTYMGKGWISPNAANEVWLRLGVDGTLVWQTGVESVTLSFAHPQVAEKPQLAHLLALLVGHESRGMLDSLFSSVQVQSTYLWDAQFSTLRARLFVCGDHMARVRLRQCCGATARADTLRMCPYCDLSPAAVRRCTSPVPAELLQVDRRFGFPIHQSPPELLHLTVNVLRFMLRNFARALYPRHVTSTAHTRIANKWLHLSTLRTSSDHTAAFAFVKQDGWQRVENKIWRYLQVDEFGHSNFQVERRAMYLTCNLLKALFKMELSPAEVQRIEKQCDTLRSLLTNLQWSATIWVHILLLHVPTFVKQWGSLRVFCTFAVEGSHRWLKKSFRLSMKSTTPRFGSRTGLQEVLHADTAKLELARHFQCDSLLLGKGPLQVEVGAVPPSLLQLLTAAK